MNDFAESGQCILMQLTGAVLTKGFSKRFLGSKVSVLQAFVPFGSDRFSSLFLEASRNLVMIFS